VPFNLTAPSLLSQGHFTFLENTEALARHWWFMTVILAVWEAEIRRIMVQGQLGQIVHEIPSPE
jgi:hypothetical protein